MDPDEIKKAFQEMMESPLKCPRIMLWRAFQAAFSNEFSVFGSEGDLPTFPIKKDEFYGFIGDKAKDTSLDDHQLHLLWRFVYRTRIGRALAIPSPVSPKKQPIDLLIDQFESAIDHSSKIDYTGWYFLYHGSYILKDHFAVHLLCIIHKDEGILSVTDVIRNIARGRDDEIIHSEGCASIVYGAPHIVLYSEQAHENRDGFSVFVGSQRHVAERGRFMSAIGTTAGMNSDHNSYSRAALLVRAEEGKRIGDSLTTGTFPVDGLPKDWSHAENLKLLAALCRESNSGNYASGPTGLVFDDPIKGLIGRPLSTQ